MCLIIYAPKGQAVPDDILVYSAAQNSDGIGVMSSDGIRKYLGRKKLKRAKKYIETLVANEIPYAVHMRWATHGQVSFNNTHPYPTPEGSHWVMHNGVISLTTAESSKEESDTAVYVRKFMQEVGDIETDKAYYEQVGRHIGYGNKFVVMDDQARFIICNEDSGTWIGGVWYSNTYSLPDKYSARPAYKHNWSGLHGTYGNGYYRGWDDDYDASGYGYQKGFTYSSKVGRWYNPLTHVEIEKTWQNGHVSHMIVTKETAEKVTAKDATVIDLCAVRQYPDKEGNRLCLPAPGEERQSQANPLWSHEDRKAYYEALEAGLTPDQEADYYEPGELAALREQQGRVLAEAMKGHDKPEAPIGGDFPEQQPDEDTAKLASIVVDSDDDDEEPWRKYMRAVAAHIHL